MEKKKSPLLFLSLLLNGWFVVSIVTTTIDSVYKLSSLIKNEYSILITILIGLIFAIIFLFLFKKAAQQQLLLQKYVKEHENDIKDNVTILPTSDADELRKWKQLYDEGTISEEMFNKKREQIINR